MRDLLNAAPRSRRRSTRRSRTAISPRSRVTACEVSDLDNVRRQILDDLLPDATNLLADCTERLAEEAQGFAAAAPSIAQDASAAVPGAVSTLSSLLSDPARAAGAGPEGGEQRIQSDASRAWRCCRTVCSRAATAMSCASRPSTSSALTRP